QRPRVVERFRGKLALRFWLERDRRRAGWHDLVDLLAPEQLPEEVVGSLQFVYPRGETMPMRLQSRCGRRRAGILDYPANVLERDTQLPQHADLTGLLDLAAAIESVPVLLVDLDRAQHADGVIVAERLGRQSAEPRKLTDGQEVGHHEHAVDTR